MMNKIEIPAGTTCESCDEVDATVVDDHDGWIPASFYCTDCVEKMQDAYEPPTVSGGSSVVMNEYGKVF